MTSTGPDFHVYPDAVALAAVMPDSVPSGAAAVMFADRDRLLEDFLGNYQPLDLAYVTVVQGGGAATINTGTSKVRGRRLGTWAHVFGELEFTASTCAAGIIVVGLPAGWERAEITLPIPLGEFWWFDAAPVNYCAQAFRLAAGGSALAFQGLRDGFAAAMGANGEGAVAVGDAIGFNLQYELAA